MSQALEGGPGTELLQVGGERADIRRDRHAIVVEDDGEVSSHRAAVVEGLPAHSRCDRGITGDGDHALVRAELIASGGESESRRNGCSRMAGAEAVELIFLAAQEPTDALVLA